MRESFSHYVPRTNEELESLWSRALFVLDSSVLLNLYRYSPTTRTEYLEVLHAFAERLWLPHQVASEFFLNREKVIQEGVKQYKEALKELCEAPLGRLEAWVGKINRERGHPFLSDESVSNLRSALGEVRADLEEKKANLLDELTNDEVLEEVVDLFDGKVGGEWSTEQLTNVCEEGQERYKRLRPPGYEDSEKSGSDGKPFPEQRRYGDLIVWKQIMEQAKAGETDVILVTDDLKDDWWSRAGGRTLGPRPELLKEFHDETKMDFHMYPAGRFFEFASEELDKEIDDEVLREVQEIHAPAKPSRDKSRGIAALVREMEEHLGDQLRLATGGDLRKRIDSVSIVPDFDSVSIVPDLKLKLYDPAKEFGWIEDLVGHRRDFLRTLKLTADAGRLDEEE